MRKKLLSIFMALAMVLSLAPSAVMADDAAAVKYKDGTYTQSVKVKADDDKDFDDYDITVQVDIAGGKITSVTLPEDKNAFGINEDAAEDNEKYIGYVLEGRKGGAGIPAQIVEKNSADVDVVSKATCISNAMIDAVSQILAANVAKEEAPAAEEAAEAPAEETAEATEE